MVKRNSNFSKLSQSYLFPEVMRRAKGYPEAISLSIGDTSEPLGNTVIAALQEKALRLGTKEGYQGYGPEAGERALRRRIAEVFYHGCITPEEIFVSDGAKCDIGRLQLLFGSSVSIAVQDPTYPVYVDTSIIVGSESIVYLPCLAENGFFPDIEKIPSVDILYLCSPNNPTGSVATYAQLKKIVEWAKQKRSLIVFDAAYAGYIQDPSLPHSIYEIEGAKEVAIEVSSFSKTLGFTGVRLGWTVIPKTLKYYDDGYCIHTDYTRLISTFFNGASNIAQAGALAALSEEGLQETEQTLLFYRENAHLIREALKPKGFPIYGGDNAPYLWVYFGKKRSWDLFQKLLDETGLITTPGSGFGSQGEGYLRFSAFGSREHILNACERIENRWPESLSSPSLLSI